jgi:hypothetical protein
LLYAGPIVLLYALVTYYSPNLASAFVRVLFAYLTDPYKDELKAKVDVFVQQVDSSLAPLIIVFLIVMFFWTTLKIPLLIYRDTLIDLTGLYTRIDDVAQQCAEHFIKINKDYTHCKKILEQKFGEIPLPETLIQAPENTKIAYKILWLSAPNTLRLGFDGSLSDTLRQVNVDDLRIDRAPGFVFQNLVSAIVLYIVFGGIYVSLSPVIARFLVNHCWDQRHLVWEYIYSATIYSQVRFALAVVFPVSIGILGYTQRRLRFRQTESP